MDLRTSVLKFSFREQQLYKENFEYFSNSLCCNAVNVAVQFSSLQNVSSYLIFNFESSKQYSLGLKIDFTPSRATISLVKNSGVSSSSKSFKTSKYSSRSTSGLINSAYSLLDMPEIINESYLTLILDSETLNK